MPSGPNIAAACGEILLFTILGYYALKFIVGVLAPTNKQKAEAKKLAQELMKSIGVEDVALNDHEMMVASNLVDPLSISVSWDNIGGLSKLIREMKENVVLPFTKRDLFSKSLLLSPPKGVLLYGPPGCGKTMVAKATAKEAGCRFINLEVSSLTDKWYGESQKLANAVFSLAYKIQPCIIFIDEIDSFLRSRSSTDHEATAMMKAQFMSLWDGLLSHGRNDIIIMGATNRPQDVDSAILRRMPCRFYVSMPDESQRLEILRLILQDEMLEENVDLEELAVLTEKCSGSDLKELCRLAALNCIRDIAELAHSSSGNSGSDESPAEIRAINMNDFTESLQRMKNSHVLLASHGLYES